MEGPNGEYFKFDDFELDRTRRLLLKHGKPIALNSKTFDLLLALVENRGQVLTKDQLLDRVWAGHFVEEGNLKVQVSTLRKVFGESSNDHRFIVTVPGRGYSFVAALDETANGDLVIESHSLSRIVVEENTAEHRPAVEPRYEKWLRRNGIKLVVGGILVVAALAGGYQLWPRRGGVPFEKARIKRLTTSGKVSNAAMSPDGALFAYVTSDIGNRTLWLGSVAGGNDVQLRPAIQAQYSDLAFAPDSKSLFYTLNSPESSRSALWRIPAFGGVPEKVRDGIARFSLSQDGKQLAYVRNDDDVKTNRLLVSNLDGSGERIIASFPVMRSIVFNSQSWSPDGKLIAFGGVMGDDQFTDELFTIRVSDGETRRVTNFGWKSIVKTAWLREGSGLMLAAEEKDSRASVSYSQLWHVDYPGGRVTRLTNDLSSYRSMLDLSDQGILTIELRQMNNIWVAPADDLGGVRQLTFGSFGRYDGLYGMDWTADGKVVFTSTDSGSQVISQMNVDGGGITQLTAPGHNDTNLNASSDGKYILFESNRGGGADIWRMNADGSNPVQLTFGGRNYYPFVSPDSRTVYYKSFLNELGELRRIPIDGGESVPLTDIEVWWLSVSPDGKYVAAAVHTDKTRLTIYGSEGGPALKQFDLTRYGNMSLNSRWTPDGTGVAYRDMNHGYWVQPIDGSAAYQLEGLPKEKFYNFAWSKDGKWFAFVRGQEIRDVILFTADAKQE